MEYSIGLVSAPLSGWWFGSLSQGVVDFLPRASEREREEYNKQSEGKIDRREREREREREIDIEVHISHEQARTIAVSLRERRE